MAHEQNEIRVERNADIPVSREVESAEPSIGELLRRVTNDSGELVRQEIALAKAEMRESISTLAQDATKASIGLGLALVGVLALATFIITGLGSLLGGHYWLSSLIIGVIFLAIGIVLGRNALADIKRHGVMPDQTAESLRRDAAWAKREAGEVKRELTT
jgi:uncharacterized membrane protein YqjE